MELTSLKARIDHVLGVVAASVEVGVWQVVVVVVVAAIRCLVSEGKLP